MTPAEPGGHEPDPTAEHKSGPAADDARALCTAIAPILARVGGQVVEGREILPGDIPVEWGGTVALHVRISSASTTPTAVPADLSDGLSRLIGEVEQQLGGRLDGLPRADKQRAVRLLEERGAFEMRKSAETVAEALGVTRFTVYNYLNRSTGTPA